MLEPKLELQTLTHDEFVALLKLVATEMATTAALVVFPIPDVALSALSARAGSIQALMDQRAQLVQQATQLTVQIRQERNLGEGDLKTEAAYVNGIAQGDPAKIKLAGMAVTDDIATPTGPMPKVDNAHAAQGDADGEVDLNWNPVGRGLKNYRIEMTTDAAGLTGWAFKMNAGGKSRVTVTGLTSGTRYWFRIVAEGPGGEGAPSEIVTKVAP